MTATLCHDCHVVTSMGTIHGATLCPRHAAHDALVAALERLAAGKVMQVEGGIWHGDYMDIARAALAQARGAPENLPAGQNPG